MKKYAPFLFVIITILLGFLSVNSASAANCGVGELFNSSTGQPCSTTSGTVAGCVAGYLFSPISGKSCGAGVAASGVSVSSSSVTLLVNGAKSVTVPPGTEITVSWTSVNVAICHLNGVITGSSGNVKRIATTTTTHKIVCAIGNTDNAAADTAEVNVADPMLSKVVKVTSPVRGDIWKLGVKESRLLKWDYPDSLAGKNTELTVELMGYPYRKTVWKLVYPNNYIPTAVSAAAVAWSDAVGTDSIQATSNYHPEGFITGMIEMKDFPLPGMSIPESGTYKIQVTVKEKASNSTYTYTDESDPFEVKSFLKSPCPPLGDVNGDGYVTQTDYNLAGQIVAGTLVPTAAQKLAADVNKNGSVTTTDWVAIGGYVNGTIATFAGCSVQTTPTTTPETRDARRKADLAQIGAALDIYYQTNKKYPETCHWSTWSCWQTFIGSQYLSPVPIDPLNNDIGNCQSVANCHIYRYCQLQKGQAYVLTVNLENPANPPMQNYDASCTTGGPNFYWIKGQAQPVAIPAPVSTCAATNINGYSVPAKNSGERATVSISSSVANGTRTTSTTFTCNNGTFTIGSTSTSGVTCSNGYTLTSPEECTANPAPTVSTRREDISNLYRTLLNREPDSGGLDYWNSTGYTIDQIKQMFINSAEYQSLHSTSSLKKVNLSASAISAAASAGSFRFTQFLEEGSSGSEVRELQKTLKASDYYAGNIDGIFGSQLKTALISFQAANGLKQDGIVGYEMRTFLNR